MPDRWPDLLNDIERRLRQCISEQEDQDKVKLLQFNNSNRGSFQVPLCAVFPSLGSVMAFCVELTADLTKTTGTRISYFAAKMNLEQAFLAYASHQVEKEQTN